MIDVVLRLVSSIHKQYGVLNSLLTIVIELLICFAVIPRSKGMD